MKKTKLIAMYLPQYHTIPENDEFWGKGFTDWVTVKKAKPLFSGHNQPRIPEGERYYDLTNKDVIIWQANLAKEYGIDGFGVYHYWFNNEKNLLTKPAETIRDTGCIDYFLAWDNGNWKRSWSNVDGNAWSPLADNPKTINKGPAILIPYILGTEQDWENHYNSVRTHFLSKTYIKVDNCPVFIIFNYDSEIHKMCEFWDFLAKKDGFGGMYFVFRNKNEKIINKTILAGKTLHVFNYEPQTSGWSQQLSIIERIKRKIYRLLDIPLIANTYFIHDYDKVWNTLLNNAKNKYSKERYLHGAFVNYDDTPRRGNKGGRLMKNATPLKFSSYLKEIIDISDKQNKPFVFLTAWNEWGEGAYLEPDTVYGLSFLKAVANIK